MTRHYPDSTESKFPLYVVRALVHAAAALKTGEEWTTSDDERLKTALHWISGRPIYREEVLEDGLDA